MTENPFAGSTRDPIALLEQLIVQVGGLNGRMGNLEQGMESLNSRMGSLEKGLAEVKQDLVGVKQDLAGVKQETVSIGTRLERVEKEVSGFRADTMRMVNALNREQTSLEAKVVDTIERKGEQVRFEMQDRFASIERRLAELEEAERRRKEGMGA